jgi:hypothetical protein
MATDVRTCDSGARLSTVQICHSDVSAATARSRTQRRVEPITLVANGFQPDRDAVVRIPFVVLIRVDAPEAKSMSRCGRRRGC